MRWLALLAIPLFTSVAYAELPSASDAVVRQAMTSGKPTVVDLGARTCVQCKKMAPILEALSKEYQGKANVLFIDVRTDQLAAQNMRVQMIPTQIFFNAQGKEVHRHTGFMDKADIVKGLRAAGLK